MVNQCVVAGKLSYSIDYFEMLTFEGGSVYHLIASTVTKKKMIEDATINKLLKTGRMPELI